MTQREEERLLSQIERAERTGTTAQLANALDHLAGFYHHGARYGEAAPIYARALGLWRQILGPEHPSVGTLLVNLGAIYHHLGDLGSAEPLMRQAVAIFEDDLNFDDDGAVEILERFVSALRHDGRIEEALRLGERLQKIAALVRQVVRV